MNRCLEFLVICVLALGVVSTLQSCADEAAVKLKADRAAFDEALGSVQSIPAYVSVPLDGVDLNRPADQIANQLNPKLNKTFADLAKNADLQAARQKHIDTAAAELQKVLNLGTPDQQAAALSLLADAYASQGRYGHRAAMTAWSDIYHDSGELISYITAADITDHRARTFKANVDALKQELDTYQNQTKGERENLKTRADELNDEINALEQEIASFTQKRDSATLRSQKLRADATAKTGDQQFQLTLQAIKAERESSKAATEIEKREIRLDLKKHELSIVDRKLKVKESTEDEIDTALTGTEKRKESHMREQGEAVRDLNATADELKAAFKKVDEAYTAQVEQGLEKAAENLEKSVTESTNASRKASDRSTKSMAELTVVTRQVELIYVLTEHCEAASGYGNNLATLTSRAKALGLKEIDQFETRYNDLRKKQEEMGEKAAALASEAEEAAKDIGESAGQESDAGGIARRQQDHLLGYRERLEASKLAGQIRVGSATRASLGDAPEVVGPAPTPTPPPTAGGASTITDPVGNLPDLATADNVFAVVRIEGRHLSPKIIKDTVSSLAGADAAKQATMPLMMFTGMYGQFAQAGVKGIVGVVSIGEQGEPDEPFFLISAKEGTNPEGLKQLMGGLPDGEQILRQAEFKQVDPEWIVMYKQSKEPSLNGSAARRALIEAALGANGGDAAVSVALLMDEKVKALMEMGAAMANQQAGGAAPVDVAKGTELLGKAQWLGLALKLGDNVGIYTTTKFMDEATATEANSQFDAELQKLLQPPADPAENPLGPMAGMIGGMIKNAVQVSQDGDKLSINLAGPGFKSAVQGLIGMAMMAGGGGPGGPGPGGGGGPPAPAPDPFK